jgi:endonuclease YncB( thermonuclease family)
VQLIIAVLALLFVFTTAKAEPVTVLRVIDGDTLIIGELCSPLLPGSLLRIRVRGIDTPESRRPPAKCASEAAAGKAATLHARTLVKPGDVVRLSRPGPDKYACRIVADVRLASGRDFGAAMIAAGHARAYDGKRKASWCPARVSSP